MSQGGSAGARGRGGRGIRGWGRGRWRGRGSYGGGSSSSYSSQRVPPIQQTLESCIYPAWNSYIPEEVYSASSSASKNVQGFKEYFNFHKSFYDNDEVRIKGTCHVDYGSLISDKVLLEYIPDVATRIQEQPEIILNCAALGLHTVLAEDEMAGSSQCVSPFDVPRLYVRLTNYQPVLPLKVLKASQFGRCIAVRGTVVRTSNVKPLVTRMAFKCAGCSGTQVVCLPDGKYALPSKCSSQSCNAKFFIPLRSSPLTETIDRQSIRIQEVMDGDLREAGRVPRTMEAELTADLVDCCCPGDVVTITAIVKATGSDVGHSGRNSKDHCTFHLYLHAISISNDKLMPGGEPSSSSPHVEFSTKDYYAIQEIQGDKDVFKLIVGSLCPGIYGHEVVKAGLVLGLFGGSHSFTNDKNAVPIRGDPHILIVGDPGLGKSQMLQAAANTAPTGVYVCGHTSTVAGLTVTVSKDSSSNDYSLDAGALVLADQGCCCIDEFDKMGNQHQALLEAMEQQTISIAKAGIICSLPARTSILAAANPAGGHYNKAKTVSENLKMGSALLSRFDLVFILLDRPDEELDCLLSKHVMSLHSAPTCKIASHASKQLLTTVTVRRNSSISLNTSTQSSVLWGDDDVSLAERLKVLSNEVFDPVPTQLLRKYIAYARKYVHPNLSSEAADVIQKFYLKLRKQRQGIDSTPITTRQLESMIRLTEARARLELRETATAKDAQDVIEIFKHSLYDAYSDEMGIIDFSRSQNGSGMASQSQAKRFVAELNRVAETTFNSFFTTQQLKDISKKLGIKVACFEDFISSLNYQNYLLKKGPKTYQLQTYD